MTFSPFQATLTEERDRLAKEKETWKKTSDVPSGVPESWEAEKAEIVKNRDEAMTQAKVE